jgi:uncharacterized protein YjhX (UPF0386 family)
VLAVAEDFDEVVEGLDRVLGIGVHGGVFLTGVMGRRTTNGGDETGSAQARWTPDSLRGACQSREVRSGEGVRVSLVKAPMRPPVHSARRSGGRAVILRDDGTEVGDVGCINRSGGATAGA